MSNKDFSRRMPEAGYDLRRREGLLRQWHIDIYLLLLLIAITGYGLVVLFSASDGNTAMFELQVKYFIVGFIGMVVVAQIPLPIMARWSPLAYVGCVAALIAVLLIGQEVNGSKRWLNLGYRFQPSEFLKLVVPVTVAAFFAKKVLPPSLPHILLSLLLIGVPAGLINRQPDLGTSIIVASSGLFVLFFSGLLWRYIMAAIATIGASGFYLWGTLEGYQRQRILTLFNPDADTQGAGWNIAQSTTAIGSGGLEGKGWLDGTQSHLDFLPESHTDFITAVLAEEFGFLGFLVMLSLYFLVIARGFIIALQSQDTFSRLVSIGITLTFFVYVFVNIGMVSGILPIVGVPLPLVSRGGTSVVTLLLGFGVLMAVSTQQRRVTL